MTDLNNKVVLITGAYSGFGREMIRQFLKRHFPRLLTYLIRQLEQRVSKQHGNQERNSP